MVRGPADNEGKERSLNTEDEVNFDGSVEER